MNPTSPRRHLILGSSLGLVIGATIMILLHESAHAVSGALAGSRPTQLPFAVDDTPALPVDADIVTTLAGPVFSLVSGLIGIVIDWIAVPLRERPFWRMVWLWFVFTSVQEGLGYLQITALFGAGDTAQALDLMNAPPLAYVLFTVVGWALLPVTAWLFAHRLRPLASSVSDKRSLAVWPWLIGTGSLLVLMGTYAALSPVNDAEVIITVLAGVVGIGVYAPMSMMFGSKLFGASTSPSMPWPPVGGLVLLGALIAFNLVLTGGWLWP